MKQIAVLEAAKHARVASSVSEIELSAKVSEIDSLKATVESLRGRLSKKVDDSAGAGQARRRQRELAEMRVARRDDALVRSRTRARIE